VKNGSSSPAKVFTVTNTGTADLHFTSLYSGGPDTTQFSPVSGCNTFTAIASGASCTVTVTFKPNATGSFSANFNFASNTSTTPDQITYAGIGATEISLNGGFNTYAGASKIPTNWTANKFGISDGKDIIAANHMEGTASLKMMGKAATTKTLTQTLNIGGSTTDNFLFSFWVKGTSIPVTGTCQGQFLLYNGASLVTTKTVPCGTGTFGYKKLSLSFLAGGTYTQVIIKLTYAKSTGTVWFDGLSLLKAP
jgi:hypothetical protein